MKLAAIVAAFVVAAASASSAAAQASQQYTLATCDLTSRESFKVSWTGVAAVIEQSDDLNAACLGLAPVGADVGAFPVACDGSAPLFEAVLMVPSNPPYTKYASLVFQVNTTAFAGLCLGTKVPAAVGNLVFALPCDLANPNLAWIPSPKGGVRSFFNSNPSFPVNPGTPAFCLNATATNA